MDLFKCVMENDGSRLRVYCSRARAENPKALEIVDQYGNTPLLKACYLGRYEAALTLIGYGGSVKAINYFGQNALTLATHSGNYHLVVELLRYRTYEDFNLSSIIPALIVATMRQDARLITFFQNLSRKRGEILRTVHDLSAYEVNAIFKQSQQHAGQHHRRIR